MVAVDCEHAPNDNPRFAGSCRKCGQALPALPQRDREFERQLTHELAGGLSIDIGPLVDFAERRADRAQDDYGYDFPDLSRDLGLEALEEVADGRNYIVWWLDAIHRDLKPGGDRVMHLQRALRHLALAFEEVRHAR